MKKKIVIVGGVAGGMSAAARARRLSEEAEIIVLERSGHVSYANCGLPYYIGGEISSQRDLLVVTPELLKSKLNLDIRTHNEVIWIDRETKTVTVKNTVTELTYDETFDELILSIGAAPIRPNFAGIDQRGIFSLRNIEDVEAIDSWIRNMAPATAVIAGGGFIGLEMAEQLARRGLSVTLVDVKDQVLAPIDPEMATIVHDEMRKNGIRLILGKPIAGFREPAFNPGVGADGRSPESCWVEVGDSTWIPSDLVILGLGVRPEVKLARSAKIDIGERGGIRVNEHMQTSVPNIWAVGDAVEVWHPVSKTWTLIALGGPANRQGRIAADNIFGHETKYDGTLGTAILRVFDLAVACVGLNEGQLRQAKLPYEVVHIHPSHHAGYYPGAARLDMKVIFDAQTGMLLGAQVIGKEGADKRIDVLATAIKSRMTIRDLAELELAYAPPFGSAKDPINLAGMAGSNILDGYVEQVQWHELQEELNFANVCVLDVRSKEERSRGFIEDSVHIPLPELRTRMRELQPEKTVVVYCQSGQRSYMACRQLKQHGFNVKNLSGGYLTYRLNPQAQQNAAPVNRQAAVTPIHA